jgi:hypothetical protein
MEIQLDLEYIRLLKKMKLMNNIFFDNKLISNNIKIYIDESNKTRFKTINFETDTTNKKMDVLTSIMKRVTKKTNDYIIQVFDIKINECYLEKANDSFHRIQQTRQYRNLLKDIYSFTFKGDAESIKQKLIDLKNYVSSMLEKEWIAK